MPTRPHKPLMSTMLGLLLVLIGALWTEVAPAATDRILVVMETDNDRHQALFAAFQGATETSRNGTSSVSIQVKDVSQVIESDPVEAPSDPSTLIVTVGTRAAERELQRDDATPVLSVLLPDIALRQLQQRHGMDETRETAAIVLDQPVARQFAVAATLLPDAQLAGALFSDDDPVAIANFRTTAARFGLTADPEKVTDEDEAADHIEALMRRSDVVLAVYDHRLFRPVTAKWMLYIGFQERRPIIGFSYALLKAGAVAAVYSTPEQIGVHAAETAQAWLEGQAPVTTQPPAYFNIAINGPVADALGIRLPDEAAFRQRVRQRLGEPG